MSRQTMSDASSSRPSSSNVSHVDGDRVNEQLARFATEHNVSIDEVRARAAIVLAFMTSEPSQQQSPQREVASSQHGASNNATVSFTAEPEANMPAPSGSSNAQSSAEPSNAPAESVPANSRAGRPPQPRLFETLVTAQIDNLNDDVAALNSRMASMHNRIAALEANFEQLNATHPARTSNNRQDNQSGGVQTGGLDPLVEMERELTWLAANPPPPESPFPEGRRGDESGEVDTRTQADKELAWLDARKARRGKK
ncbi:hypothetical protein KC356_g7173 [Hortaea werneckii]|nr:hypothetical protein KC356_g7173 [Hortaea werneckii]